VILLAAFVVSGILRGSVAQVFAFSGTVVGILVGALVADLVGSHWRGAHPEYLYLLLRWAVAMLIGFGIAGLIQWWGGTLSKAVHDGPFGGLDRGLGAVMGLAIGSVIAAVLLVFLFQVPGLGLVQQAAARGVLAPPILAASDRAGEWGRALPGGLWLHEQTSRAARTLAARRSD
jgi:uncharacterized membrane protein required for colicin V production